MTAMWVIALALCISNSILAVMVMVMTTMTLCDGYPCDHNDSGEYHHVHSAVIITTIFQRV